MRTNKIMSGVAAAALIGAIGYAVPASAQIESHTVTSEKTTTYTGTVQSIEPSSSTIILKGESSPEPMRYTFTKNTTFVDANGNVVSQESIRNSPVTVQYTQEGDRMVVTKVTQVRPAGGVVEHRSTTTETHTHD